MKLYLVLSLLLSKHCLGDVTYTSVSGQPGTGVSSANSTCGYFKTEYPDITFFPNDTEYKTLNEDYWSANAWLGPACIFAPDSAEVLGFAVKTLRRTGVQFATRGGGHMPIAGYANIDNRGILLSSSGFTQLRFGENKKTVSTGPGNRWGAVYRFLEPHGLNIVGGRMGVVGIPGFVTGGGISFFGNEHGWASANCVLASGDVVNATAANEYSDLFWALRGGGNSFAIVTNLELKTIYAPKLMVGQHSYGSGGQVRDAFLESVYSFAHNGTLDKKAAITPQATWSPSTSNETAYNAFLFYNGNEAAPASLANFTGENSILPPVSGDFFYRTFANWSSETENGFERTHGMRVRFHILSIEADRQAIEIIHDTFFDAAKKRLSAVEEVLTTLAIMPIPESFITTNRDGPCGDPMGIDASKAPYIWVEETYMYKNADDKSVIDQFVKDVNKDIHDKLAPLNVESPYLYLNDANSDQPVFEGYLSENVQRLKEIREKYDPSGLYTYQMPGGFKVAHA